MNTIVVPFDFNKQSNLALEWSIPLAKQTNSSITLLYVYETASGILPFRTRNYDEELLERISDELDAVAAKLSVRSGVTIDIHMLEGRVYSTIVDFARKAGSLFIVMGTGNNQKNGEGVPVVGRNTSRVIRMASCPVISIGGTKNHHPIRSVLLPLDLTKTTTQKIDLAIHMAKIFGSQIRAVSSLWSLQNPEVINRLNTQMDVVKAKIEAAGVQCTAQLIQTPDGASTAVPAILNYAADAGDIDLIVIMTQQESALVELFVGSHAQEFIRHSEIPVMSVIPVHPAE